MEEIQHGRNTVNRITFNFEAYTLLEQNYNQLLIN